MNDKTDFSICDFIEERMWFFTYYDFCDNRKQIKRLFDDLTRQEKAFYKCQSQCIRDVCKSGKTDLFECADDAVYGVQLYFAHFMDGSTTGCGKRADDR